MEARRQRRRLMAEINVVPLIDVMLVLLIVFMITAPLITQGVRVDLPEADAEIVDDNDELTLVVSIDAAGLYYISLGEVSEEPNAVPLEIIGENVSRIMNQNPSVPVFLEADAAVNYGLVMSLMATLEDAGAPSVRLITQPPMLSP
ncbi:MAG: protein TolR [SAR86 cluster bacterium]|uniref:Tol-Pal system protein TolR n=1 Tax=SAR86 cluster bacterium TaxID=2030880 RepID=A0A2A5CEA7_9GAMM|nr:MAG: protein TolR [SAR86 cluster bacterium]